MSSKEIEELHRKMDNIERLLKENSENCQKMSNHIDFVERIYEYVKRPLFFLTERIKRLSSFQQVPIEYTPHEAESSNSG